MKLDDIDILNKERAEYQKRRVQLSSVIGYRPISVAFNNSRVEDGDIMHAVRNTIMPMIQQKLDESKTKLMMLGITEFPPE